MNTPSAPTFLTKAERKLTAAVSAPICSEVESSTRNTRRIAFSITPETEKARLITRTEAMMMMTCGRFRHLPVLERGVLIGLISIGDAVKARIMQTDQDVDSLRNYVTHSA